ncbi:BRO-N domain-containing protein [Campylobacter insulaenigrae]|uniref:BRO-N domain-containing protein n=1 Tax=Campylobacter insulaenigrae TaxID=260714 RepID=UPI002152E87A|nr:BRO family protein [Campylobacter insulaenigrae]MCR6580367.1 BRO family protein [Campylobacter insulaenigrae]
MSKVVLFENKKLGQVRTIRDKNNEPLFCLSDICKILEIKNSRDVKSSILKEFEGCRLNLHPFETNGGKQNFVFITEPQLYFVLMRSDKPKAKPFRQWVIKEVLPSIRKQGYYSINKLENQNRYLADLMELISPNLPQSDYKINIVITDKPHSKEAKNIFSLNYLVDNRTPKDPKKLQ